MSSPVRIVVVDDHALFRRGLVGLLSEMPGFQVVGQAGNGLDALPVIAEARPDVVLLDVNMPGMSGIEIIPAIRKTGPSTRILMLTVSQEETDLVGAITAGADGYLLKNSEPEELQRTIRRAAAGHSVLSPEITDKVFRLLRRKPAAGAADLLSEREIEVLRCLARGQTTALIAAELFISENTVKTHIRHILEKMEVNNRAEAVARAGQLGLLG